MASLFLQSSSQTWLESNPFVFVVLLFGPAKIFVYEEVTNQNYLQTTSYHRVHQKRTTCRLVWDWCPVCLKPGMDIMRSMVLLLLFLAFLSICWVDCQICWILMTFVEFHLPQQVMPFLRREISKRRDQQWIVSFPHGYPHPFEPDVRPCPVLTLGRLRQFALNWKHDYHDQKCLHVLKIISSSKQKIRWKNKSLIHTPRYFVKSDFDWYYYEHVKSRNLRT